MKKTIEIGNKEIEFLANAATPFRFRQVFGKDLLTGVGMSAEGTMAEGEAVDYIIRLAFIMKEQATGKANFGKLTEEDFFKWLEQFESMDLFDHIDEILSVWLTDQQTMSTPT